MAKKPTVMGISGKTHGVRLSARPPRKMTTESERQAVLDVGGGETGGRRVGAFLGA